MTCEEKNNFFSIFLRCEMVKEIRHLFLPEFIQLVDEIFRQNFRSRAMGDFLRRLESNTDLNFVCFPSRMNDARNYAFNLIKYVYCLVYKR